MTMLAMTRPEMPCCNLFTLVRHRRLATVGPWFDHPDGTWSRTDLEGGLCLFSADTSFQQCPTMVDQILASNTLKIDGHEVRYEINPNPRRHRAYRDDRSPFKHHPGPDSPISAPLRSTVLKYTSIGASHPNKTDKNGGLCLRGCETKGQIKSHIWAYHLIDSQADWGTSWLPVLRTPSRVISRSTLAIARYVFKLIQKN
ncbi:MAG: hypothetical protein OXI23_09800 [Gemmatimonadota bacterium]|nr:hypothetical protein [Gemmatimonadota bacterium]